MKGEGRQTVLQTDRQQRELYYAGRVQGIGFRYTARSLAGGFDVAGFVRNLPDGRVHLVVEGATAELDKFLDAVKAEIGYYVKEIERNGAARVGPLPGIRDSTLIEGCKRGRESGTVVSACRRSGWDRYGGLRLGLSWPSRRSWRSTWF